MALSKEKNVVQLVAQGNISGQFSVHSFNKLSPLVRIPLTDIIGEEFLAAGHVFLGFMKSGRYLLSYTKAHLLLMSDSEDDPAPFLGYNHTLYWWEFNQHSKLKLVQQVKLFENFAQDKDLNLHVCEWPNDDSKIAIFGFDAQSTSTDQLMISLQNNDVLCCCSVTIAPNPPSKPCPHCSATTTPTGSGGKCLEHGYVLHREREVRCPFPFQPALQLKKDKVILLKENLKLVACAIHLCPAGEQSQILYTKRAAPPSGHGSSASSPSSSPTLPSSSSPTLPSSSSPTLPSSSSPTLPSSSSTILSSSQEDADQYVRYKRLHYHLPGAAGENVEHVFLQATDLKGRLLKLLPGGPHDGQSLCVEEMELNIDHLIYVLLNGDAVWDPLAQYRSDMRGAGLYHYYKHMVDFVILEVCPETDKVLIDIALFLNCEERNMQVSWDLSTGLCSVIGVSDHTKDVPCEYLRAVKSHRKSCVDTVTECSVPESSSHHVNVLEADDDLPKRALEDTERCTWVTR